jgi:hypothetical protein
MASYPVEAADTSGVVEAVNNLLSGPGGLGQDFSGFSSYVPAFTTGSTRTPYTSPGIQTTGTTVNGAFTVRLTASFNADQLRVGMTVRTQGLGVATGAVITNIGATTTAGTVVTLDLANTATYNGVVTFLAFPIPQVFVAPIPLSVSQMLSGDTWQFTFASPQAAPPFVNGQGINIADVVSSSDGVSEFSESGTKAASASQVVYTNITPITVTGSGSGAVLTITLEASISEPYNYLTNSTFTVTTAGTGYAVGDDLKVLGTALGGTTPANDLTLNVYSISGYYDGDYTPIGVVSCSTTQVIARTRGSFTIVPPGSGGEISYSFTRNRSYRSTFDMSTDCNSKVVVTGGTDRVFVAGQVNNTISYTATTASDLYYTVKITRYIGSPNTNLVNPGFVFDPDETVASKEYEFPGLNGTGTLPVVDTVFSTLVDADIAPGYYWYILDINFYRTSGDIEVTTCELAQRSFTAQVVKQ